jgi:hypothetical protein
VYYARVGASRESFADFARRMFAGFCNDSLVSRARARGTQVAHMYAVGWAQYAMLHLTGYAVSMDDLKAFRQLHSITPGHPEVRREFCTCARVCARACVRVRARARVCLNFQCADVTLLRGRGLSYSSICPLTCVCLLSFVASVLSSFRVPLSANLPCYLSWSRRWV